MCFNKKPPKQQLNYHKRWDGVRSDSAVWYLAFLLFLFHNLVDDRLVCNSPRYSFNLSEIECQEGGAAEWVKSLIT